MCPISIAALSLLLRFLCALQDPQTSSTSPKFESITVSPLSPPFLPKCPGSKGQSVLCPSCSHPHEHAKQTANRQTRARSERPSTNLSTAQLMVLVSLASTDGGIHLTSLHLLCRFAHLWQLPRLPLSAGEMESTELRVQFIPHQRKTKHDRTLWFIFTSTPLTIKTAIKADACVIST